MTTLYVSDIKTSISLSSRHLNLYRDNDDGAPELQSRLPLHCLRSVAVVGRSRVSMRAVHEFMRRDIPVHVLEADGRHAGSFCPRRDGDALLRIRQYQMHESRWATEGASRIVAEKLLNTRRVLQRLAARFHQLDHPAVRHAIGECRRLAGRAAASESLATLRGIEGAGSAAYFATLPLFVPPAMKFRGRNRRPPRDPVNALLSWTYTIVAMEIRGAIWAAGLDPCIGIYHGLGYGRPALALDLLELFRAPLCDLLVLRLLNLGILKEREFTNDPETGCRLASSVHRAYFEQHEGRMTAAFRLAGETRETCYRELIRRAVASYAQALHDRQPYAPPAVR